jgi:hypothetical protein
MWGWPFTSFSSLSPGRGTDAHGGGGAGNGCGGVSTGSTGGTGLFGFSG